MMTTDIDDPRYRVPGSRLVNATAWIRTNVIHDPPVFWHRHRVVYTPVDEYDEHPDPGTVGTVTDVYPDCDLTPLYDVAWDTGTTSRGLSAVSLTAVPHRGRARG